MLGGSGRSEIHSRNALTYWSNSRLLPAEAIRGDARESFSCEVSPELRRGRSLPANSGKRPRSEMQWDGERLRTNNFLQQDQLGQNRQAHGMR